MVELTPDVAVVKYTTAQGDQFELRIEIPENFPAAMPETYVSKPKPLKTRDGKNMTEVGPSHEFHMLQPKDGYVFLGVEFLLHPSTKPISGLLVYLETMLHDKRRRKCN